MRSQQFGRDHPPSTSMWLNLLVASTNLLGLVSIYRYTRNRLYLYSLLIFLSMTSSIVYHLVESIKHSMPGMGVDPDLQIILLNLDRFAAVTAMIASSIRVYKLKIPLKPVIPILCVGLFALIVPEVVSGLYSSGVHASIVPSFIESINQNDYKVSVALEQGVYVVEHSIWHISMYTIANYIALY